MIRIVTLGSVALLGLAACSSPEQVPPTSAPPTPQTSPTPTNALTAEGYGSLRIGMTRADVIAAMGATDNPDGVGGPDPESCDMFHPSRAPEGLYVMLEHGVLTSIHLASDSLLKTDRVLGIGDAAATVKQVYGPDAEVSPHKYADAPAEYITVWTTPDHDSAAARGVRYNVGTDGRVQGIAVGSPSILYVEGCA